jgi:transcriptional regulator with XRE-family HTH domain
VTAPDPLTDPLAHAVLAARTQRALSIADLAKASGVSRAMISRVERGAAQPTAALLSRIATALGLTLSELIARAEGSQQRLARREDQPLWTDPATGYTRRTVSPPARNGLELIDVELPAGAQVSYSAATFGLIDQQIWVITGHLRFAEGADIHDLYAGDCLQLGIPADCTFVNPTDMACRYLVVLHKLSSRR